MTPGLPAFGFEKAPFNTFKWRAIIWRAHFGSRKIIAWKILLPKILLTVRVRPRPRCRRRTQWTPWRGRWQGSPRCRRCYSRCRAGARPPPRAWSPSRCHSRAGRSYPGRSRSGEMSRWTRGSEATLIIKYIIDIPVDLLVFFLLPWRRSRSDRTLRRIPTDTGKHPRTLHRPRRWGCCCCCCCCPHRGSRRSQSPPRSRRREECRSRCSGTGWSCNYPPGTRLKGRR